MESVPPIDMNQMDDEKTRSQMKNIFETDCQQDEVKIKTPNSSEKDTIPEIVDIYDYIYGNVQNKLEFYERKISVTSISRKTSVDNESARSIGSRSGSFSIPHTPSEGLLFQRFDFQTNMVDINNTDLLEEETNDNQFSKNTQCHECDKNSFVKDKTEILTEINTQLKIDLEDVKENLKKEILRTNQLNFEIANIENILETFYKETSNNKSHFSTIYSAMKEYVVEQNNDYTYKRIKALADYVERLKNKLDSQDKIIKNNFLGNPYSTDLMVKHSALLRQLDEMSKENEYLKNELQSKASESIDIIKELNRQKFEVEDKCRELENTHKLEIVAKEDLAKKAEANHDQQVEELQRLLKRKDNNLFLLGKSYKAKINNFKTELNILYSKLKDQNKV